MNTGYYKGGCSNPADKLMNGRQGWLAKWANHLGVTNENQSVNGICEAELEVGLYWYNITSYRHLYTNASMQSSDT